MPIIIFIVLSTMVVLLSPLTEMNMVQPDYFTQDFVDAEVLEVISEDITDNELFPGRYTGSQKLMIGILEGKYKNQVFKVDNPLSDQHYVYVEVGDVAIASIEERGGDPSVWLYNYKREGKLILLIALFFVLLLVFGKIQGFYSILSLIFTGIMFVFFMLPMIFRGYNPIVITIITAIVITFVSFILISGFQQKTTIAILGTMVGVIIAGIVSFIFGQAANLTGMSMEKGQELIFIAQDYQIQVKGLLFSAILIASLGAVMDVAMSIVSAMIEIYKVNAKLTRKELVSSGLSVGRDVMGTMSNTLILAFMGSSLNTALLLWGYQMSQKQMLNIPFLGVEIIQGISGSIGIVLTVPITALIAAFIIKKNG